MSRTRKAIIFASFGYGQFGLAIISGIILIPFVLSHLGARTYGLWLASGELLTYAAVLDFGVFSVLPWMIAEADGRKDSRAINSFVVQGLIVGLVVSLIYTIGMCLLWVLLPSALSLTAVDRLALGKPLVILVTITALTYPLRVFSAALVGLQDVIFTGSMAVLQMCLSISLTVILLLKGYGLYALAIAGACPLMVTGVGCLLRVKSILPNLLSDYKRPTIKDIRSLLVQGLGGWMSSFGVQMLAASNGLVITFLGHPEWVPVYGCTAKLSQLLLQICWVLPDSGLAGLAQLHGEGRRERVGSIVGSMLRMHLILSGAAACVLFALNPSFVRWWVGPNLFGGWSLNMMLAIGAIVSSLIHGLVVATAVLGNRIRLGIATLFNGAVHVVLAIVLGSRFGLYGIALAAILSGVLTTLPLGLRLLQPATGLSLQWLLVGLCAPWLARIVPLLALAAVVGFYFAPSPLWGIVIAGFGIGLVYLWWMRSLYRDLPLDPRLRHWLVILKLTPPIAPTATSIPILDRS